MEIEKAQKLWQPEPGWLNTASYGLPPEPAWTALQDGSRRVAGRRHVVGGVGRVGAALPYRVRGSDRRAGQRRGGRCRRVPDSRAGRGGTARRCHGGGAGRSSSPRTCSRGWSRRSAASRSAPCRWTRLVDAIDADTDLVAFSLVQSADGVCRRVRRDRRGGPRARRVGGGGRDPGVRMAAVRREPRRRGGGGRLQVADESARHRVRLSGPGVARAAAPGRGRLVCGPRPARLLLRPAAAAGRRRPPVRHLAGLVQLGRCGARPGAGRRASVCRRSGSTTWRWPTGS